MTRILYIYTYDWLRSRALTGSVLILFSVLGLMLTSCTNANVEISGFPDSNSNSSKPPQQGGAKNSTSLSYGIAVGKTTSGYNYKLGARSEARVPSVTNDGYRVSSTGGKKL